MKKYKVYIHTCPNNKKYIGVTSQNDADDRWLGGHGYRNNEHFFRAIKKYGWSKILHEIVGDGLTEEQAIGLERELIKTCNTMNPMFGYNNTNGGEIKKEYSEESIRKMSENRKKIYSGEEHYCYGKTPEEIFGKEGIDKCREKTIERLKGPNNPQRLNPKFGADHPSFGKHISEEVRQRMIKGHTNSKIKKGDALKIMKLYYETDMMQKEIATQFGLVRQTISDVINGRIYSHETNVYIKPTNKRIRKAGKRNDQRNPNA